MSDLSGGTWAWIIANYEGLLVAGQGAIVLGAAVGLGLAAWRIRVANRQANAAQETAEASLQQARVAEWQAKMAWDTLTTNQYRIGVELLGSQEVTTRLAGITILTDMMQKNPPEYHVYVMRLFVAFLADPPSHPSTGKINFDSPDLVEILAVINETGEEERDLEKADLFDLMASLDRTQFSVVNGKIWRPDRWIPEIPPAAS